jgi:hypothetical protein
MSTEKNIDAQISIEIWETFRVMIRDQQALWSSRNLEELIKYVHTMPDLIVALETEIHNKRDLQCTDPIRMDRFRSQHVLNVLRSA